MIALRSPIVGVVAAAMLLSAQVGLRSLYANEVPPPSSCRLKTQVELELEQIIDKAYRSYLGTRTVAGVDLVVRIPFGQSGERRGSAGFYQRIFLDGKGDERDQPFLLGATNIQVPIWKVAYLAILRRFYHRGVTEINGHMLYNISAAAYGEAERWLDRTGIFSVLNEEVKNRGDTHIDKVVDEIVDRFAEQWEAEAGVKTYGRAVADAMAFHIDEGQVFDITVDEWLEWSMTASLHDARERLRRKLERYL